MGRKMPERGCWSINKIGMKLSERGPALFFEEFLLTFFSKKVRPSGERRCKYLINQYANVWLEVVRDYCAVLSYLLLPSHQSIETSGKPKSGI